MNSHELQRRVIERVSERLAIAVARVRLASAKTQHEDSPLHIALGNLYGAVGSIRHFQPEGEDMVCVPREWLTYRVFKDGNAWVAIGPDFINLQESDAYFADTPEEALRAMLSAAQPKDSNER